jgi:hypothetical protein
LIPGVVVWKRDEVASHQDEEEEEKPSCVMSREGGPNQERMTKGKRPASSSGIRKKEAHFCSIGRINN